jgi:hypothetical protein
MSNILSLCSSLNVRKHISDPHKTGKIPKTCQNLCYCVWLQ